MSIVEVKDIEQAWDELRGNADHPHEWSEINGDELNNFIVDFDRPHPLYHPRYGDAQSYLLGVSVGVRIALRAAGNVSAQVRNEENA